jgi:formate--tetrahydrofolate ligase
VAINRFPSDTEAEIEKVTELCQKEKARVALSEVYSEGGKGGSALAQEILKSIEEDENTFQPLYPSDMPLIEKIETIARKIYGAASVAMEGKTRRKIRRIEREGFSNLPVCIAKTQYSFSDDDEVLGRPKDFTLIVTDASLSAGAGFVVVYCGDIMTMPGLPKIPSAERIDVADDSSITGLS